MNETERNYSPYSIGLIASVLYFTGEERLSKDE